MEGCIFCKIANGEIPAATLWEAVFIICYIWMSACHHLKGAAYERYRISDFVRKFRQGKLKFFSYLFCCGICFH